MSEVLSKEGVGELAWRGAISLALAGMAYAFVRARGGYESPPQTGGWTPLTLVPEIDHPELTWSKQHPLIGKEITVVEAKGSYL